MSWMGWEGRAFYGAAGSTASTQLTETADLSVEYGGDMGNDTVRGDSSGPPIATERRTTRTFQARVQMKPSDSDTALEAMRTAAANGTAIALRLIGKSGGKGYDGDVNVSVTHNAPLQGEQALDFTLTPNKELRVPQLYV